jgi:hypothetical protein
VGTTGCAANEAWTMHGANGSILSAMSGKCVGVKGKELEVDTCEPGNTKQKWTWTSSAESGGGARGVQLVAETGLCLDNTVTPTVTPATCELASAMPGIKSGGKTKVVGGAHPNTPYEAGGGPSVRIVAKPSGAVVWFSPSIGAVDPDLDAPPPAEVTESTVLAVRTRPLPFMCLFSIPFMRLFPSHLCVAHLVIYSSSPLVQ